MEISPDRWILCEWGALHLNATIVFTWVVMALLVLGSWAVTARLSEGETVSRWQVMLEVIVSAIRDQIAEVGTDTPGRYLPFIGTLFLWAATAASSRSSSSSVATKPGETQLTVMPRLATSLESERAMATWPAFEAA